ncbi:hypothetical protein BJ508DRAFT_410962 [Ascobolus immersus RN42]|uniref:H-type lectin domain-containing protein n=1 Tax=Ascobolus immersus RN42 TaxID=1160509 RepID=A0A3N4IMY0_ASCIM|nr:hypothetical protein BJ508DRAFT_410962 [Ascobolus immersus RN42]
MSVLAPYNNAMRLGQGFNSYTQKICIDDAVVIDPSHGDNPITNDGFTMRDLVLAMGYEKGDVDDNQAVLAAAEQMKPDMTVLEELQKAVNLLESEVEEATDVAAEDIVRKRKLLEQKRARLSKAKLQLASALDAVDRVQLAKHYADRGPSQLATYSSKFVDKLSEITDDMNISGSLSIKYGMIGGSARGSFIDTDKFKQSDLNFYISVKVVNQTLSMKDALVFQGIPGVSKDNFNEVFGDSFISGFLEGGEFNAVISMRVLNTEKKTDIAAQAQVALTLGPVEANAEASVKLAKAHINENTETTIQVSWSGGGNIKPKDDPWTIDTLMKAAAAFPEMVARTPQRTYAILTKYDALRSYQTLKPAALSPLFYENATLYTNALLDSYMDYKSFYKTLQSDLAEVQAGVKVYEESTDSSLSWADSTTRTRVNDERKFSPDTKGVDLAKRAVMFQMMKIVKEVDEITRDPRLATDEGRGEQFQSSLVFNERLPKAVLRKKIGANPLKTKSDSTAYPAVYDTSATGYQSDETAKIQEITNASPEFGESLRMGALMGSTTGQLFCGLDYLKPSFAISQVVVEVTNGAIAVIDLRYTNGLTSQLGTPGAGKKVTLTVDPYQNEKIVACSIETGRTDDKSPFRITAFRLYTNRGPDLIGQADDWKAAITGKGIRGGVEYRDLELKHFDPLLEGGYFKGIWGWCKYGKVQNASTGVYRLGPIWGNVAAAAFTDPSKEASGDDEQVREFLGDTWNTLSIHPWDKHTPTTSTTVTFNPAANAAPNIFCGIAALDTFGGGNMRFRAYAENITAKEMTLAVDYFGAGSILHSGKAAWLAVPVLDRDVLTGTCQTYGTFPAARKIKFSREFNVKPQVVVWLNGIDADKKDGTRIKCEALDITSTGFTIYIDCWGPSKLYWASISWLAFTPESGIVSGAFGYNQGINVDVKKQREAGSISFPQGKFAKPPKVISAFNHLDLNGGTGAALPNARLDHSIQEITKDGAKWEIWTWGDGNLSYTTSAWVAIPQL